MTQVRVATVGDLDYLVPRERVAAGELESILRRGRILLAEDPDRRAAVGYRRIGYRDAGCLLLPDEALEILFLKTIGQTARAGLTA